MHSISTRAPSARPLPATALRAVRVGDTGIQDFLTLLGGCVQMTVVALLAFAAGGTD